MFHVEVHGKRLVATWEGEDLKEKAWVFQNTKRARLELDSGRLEIERVGLAKERGPWDPAHWRFKLTVDDRDWREFTATTPDALQAYRQYVRDGTTLERKTKWCPIDARPVPSGPISLGGSFGDFSGPKSLFGSPAFPRPPPPENPFPPAPPSSPPPSAPPEEEGEKKGFTFGSPRKEKKEEKKTMRATVFTNPPTSIDIPIPDEQKKEEKKKKKTIRMTQFTIPPTYIDIPISDDKGRKTKLKRVQDNKEEQKFKRVRTEKDDNI